MKHRLFNLAAGILFVLFMATVVMWARSFVVGDIWSGQSRSTPVRWNQFALQAMYIINSENGVIQFVVDSPVAGQTASKASHYSKPESYAGVAVALEKSGGPVVRWSGLGFMWEEFSGWPMFSSIGPAPGEVLPVVMSRWTVPYWSIALASGIPALILLQYTIRRRSRRKKRLCLTCGYDLRATPNRCPECGTAPAVAKE